MLLECCWIQQDFGHQRIRFPLIHFVSFQNCRESCTKTNWWRPATFDLTQSVAKKNGPFFPSTSLHVLKSISGDFLEDKSHLTVSAFQLVLLLFVISLHLLMYTFPYFVFFWWGLYSLDGDLDPSASAALPFSVQPRLMFLTLTSDGDCWGTFTSYECLPAGQPRDFCLCHFSDFSVILMLHHYYFLMPFNCLRDLLYYYNNKGFPFCPPKWKAPWRRDQETNQPNGRHEIKNQNNKVPGDSIENAFVAKTRCTTLFIVILEIEPAGMT